MEPSSSSSSERARARDARGRGPQAHVDAGAAQRLEHLLARERLLALDQAVAAVDQRHVRAERRPGLRHLDADDAAAEDREPRRHRASPSSPRCSSTASRRAGRGCPGRAASSPSRPRRRGAPTSVSSPTVDAPSLARRSAPRPRTSVTPCCSSHGSCAASSRLWITSSRRREHGRDVDRPDAVRPGTRAHLAAPARSAAAAPSTACRRRTSTRRRRAPARRSRPRGRAGPSRPAVTSPAAPAPITTTSNSRMRRLSSGSPGCYAPR